MSSCEPLPLEIWSDHIFMRLQVKSILRCRSVCKSWHSLVSNPYFISNHTLINQKNNNGNRVLLERWDTTIRKSSLSSHDESLVEYSHEHDDDCPELSCACGLYIVNSCNGLICLHKINWDGRCKKDSSDSDTLLIWNPAIRRIVQLPPRNLDRQTSFHLFGFDHKTCDYKLLRIGTNKYFNYNTIDPDVCEIFDLREGAWRRASLTVPSSWDACSGPNCYLDGAVHWIQGRVDDKVLLLSFNMSDEVFRETKMPFCMQRVNIKVSGCVALGGLIHVVVWKTGRDYDHILKDCSVWAMKEYGVPESWTKIFNIDLGVARRVYRPFQQLYLLGSGEVLLLEDVKGDDDDDYDFPREQYYDLYNIESKKSKRIFSSVTKFVAVMNVFIRKV